MAATLTGIVSGWFVRRKCKPDESAATPIKAEITRHDPPSEPRKAGSSGIVVTPSGVGVEIMPGIGMDIATGAIGPSLFDL